MVDCCKNSGGRVTFSVNGDHYRVRAISSVNPTNKKINVESNQDGSIYSSVEPKPATAEISISDSCGFDISEIFGLCDAQVRIELYDMNRSYLFHQAVIGGEPSLDPKTGEWSGIMVSSERVTQMNQAT